jgi:hypothetical protein
VGKPYSLGHFQRSSLPEFIDKERSAENQKLFVHTLEFWNYIGFQPVLRILDVYPGSWMFIPDPGSNSYNKRGGEKICCPAILVPTDKEL